MVKGYDPQRDDQVRGFWDKILLPLRNHNKIIPIGLAEKWIHSWYSNSKYNELFNLFSVKNVAVPKIQLKRDCEYNKYEYRVSKYTPCSWIPQLNVISICLSQMQNKLELKQSIDRQLDFSYKMLTNHRDNSKDESIILNLFDSCYQSLQILNLPDDLRRTLSKKCTKTNYYFRFFKRDRFTIDQQYKYIHKIIDELIP